MEMIFIILILCMIVVLCVVKSNKKTEIILDCSNEQCRWNNNQSCPYKLFRYKGKNGGNRRKVEGIHECCKIRQNRVKLAKIILDKGINTNNTQIIQNAKEQFERHKKEHPEEHKFLFG